MVFKILFLERNLFTTAMRLSLSNLREEGSKCGKFHKIIFIHVPRHSGTKRRRLPEFSNATLIRERDPAFILVSSVMQGAVKYLGYADEHCSEPEEIMVINAGEFGVFPPEKWHNIEVMTDDTYFNIDFFVAPEVLMEGATSRKVIHAGRE